MNCSRQQTEFLKVIEVKRREQENDWQGRGIWEDGWKRKVSDGEFDCVPYVVCDLCLFPYIPQ